MKKRSSSINTGIDPAQFNDPAALVTEWRSMVGTSASFTTHILVEKEINILEYKPTAQNMIFSFAYLLIAGFAFLMTIFVGNSMFGAIICALFLLVGVLLIHTTSGPITFDKKKGIFYKGWRLNDKSNKKTFAHLKDIHAVQLLENRAGAELNLVLKDGSRIHMITSRSKRQLGIDAELISKFLGIPVWDGISGMAKSDQ